MLQSLVPMITVTPYRHKRQSDVKIKQVLKIETESTQHQNMWTDSTAKTKSISKKLFERIHKEANLADTFI